MLFPPPGVKLRRTLETQYLTDQPTMIAEHDPRRVLLIVVVDQYASPLVAVAGSAVGLDTPVAVTGYYPIEMHFYGPEEVWALCYVGGTPAHGNILIQSVFYD